MSTRHLLAAAAIAFAALPAMAQYTTVDVSSVVNNAVSLGYGTYPTGTTTGNQGTGIPFAISPYGGSSGMWIAPYAGASITVSGIGASRQASFYALLNNTYGTPGADEYDITIATTNGDSVTYQSIGGVDTRDYNSNVFTNTIANSTTPWFDNGSGQRLDLREFILPTSFLEETIASFTITQVNPVDQALFSGITFSSEPVGGVAAVPEPSTWALMFAGLGFVGWSVRRRRADH